MGWRKEILGMILFLISSVSLFAQNVVEIKKENSFMAVPNDTSVVELELPVGAMVTVDGMKQGAKRTFKFQPLNKNYKHKFLLEYPSGETFEHNLVLRGGQRIRLTKNKPPNTRSTIPPQSGHKHAIRAVAFSQDGKKYLTGSWDKTAILWETASGKPLRTFKGHTTGVVRFVAFSPDGKQILTGSDDDSFILWETDTGKKFRISSWHRGNIYSVAFSPDGKQFLTASADNTAVLWETDSGKQLQTFKDHTSVVSSAVFSPDGKQILTGSADKTSILWETCSGKQLHTCYGHAAGIASVAFSPDGKQVITKSWNNITIQWDIVLDK